MSMRLNHMDDTPTPPISPESVRSDRGLGRSGSGESLPGSSPLIVLKIPIGGDFVSDAEIAGSDISSLLWSDILPNTVMIPKCLSRAPFKDINNEALEAVDPHLKDVPLEFIRDSLKMVGPQYYDIAATSIVSIPESGEHLPTELEVVVNNTSAEPPTHLLAVHARDSRQITIFPVHAIVLAAHCAHVPPFPYSEPRTPLEAGSALTLPVIPFLPPSPKTFPLLLKYLYHRRTSDFFAAVFPIPISLPEDVDLTPEQVEQYATTYAATFNVQMLRKYMSKVFGVWINVTALGVFDERLSRAMEAAWAVLVEALAISTGTQWKMV